MIGVRFKVRFQDWRKGDKATLKKEVADRYISMGVCAAVKPPVKRKRKTAPENKMVEGTVNK